MMEFLSLGLFSASTDMPQQRLPKRCLGKTRGPRSLHAEQMVYGNVRSCDFVQDFTGRKEDPTQKY